MSLSHSMYGFFFCGFERLSYDTVQDIETSFEGQTKLLQNDHSIIIEGLREEVGRDIKELKEATTTHSADAVNLKHEVLACDEAIVSVKGQVGIFNT